MRLLVDSQSVIWYVDQDHLLSPTARAAMTDPANDLVVSAATVWEISIKVGLRKLTLSSPYRDWMNDVVTDFDLELLPVTIDHSAA
jgi:PIN domain nuclease of toxin-antitoxin system